MGGVEEVRGAAGSNIGERSERGETEWWSRWVVRLRRGERAAWGRGRQGERCDGCEGKRVVRGVSVCGGLSYY